MSVRSICFRFFAFALPATLTLAQSIVYPTTAASSASSLQTGSGYSYVGCWNETTGYADDGGARAITGGVESANNTMTAETCLKYCAQGYQGQTMQYAGLEYGRECYCGAYLSVLTEQLNSSKCDYACDGNSSQICGGSLALTLYNLTSDSKTGVAWSMISSQPAWYGTAAVAMLIIAAIL